jgi:hypothetical protein
MIFGRVEAVAMRTEGGLRVTVYLETGQALRSVRDEEVAVLRPLVTDVDLAWHADQYAQETIGNALALEGWEVIGGGDIPEVEPGSMARSASYAVRKLYEPLPD